MPAIAQEVHSPLGEHLAMVNELLPGATPAGAYALGTITGLALMSGKFPPRAVLEVAAMAPSVQKAVDLAKELRGIMRNIQERQSDR